MLDLQQGFTVSGHQLCSSGHGRRHQANAQPASEFEFWHARQRSQQRSFDGSKLKASAENEDCFYVYSPPMWKVLPRNQRCHGRCQAQDTITAGRTELMEMIQKMPESSYELSFSDMVGAEAPQEANHESSNVEARVDFSSIKTPMISKGKKQEKRKLKARRHQISRVESMDGGNFLLKMFWPSCFAATETADGRKLSTIPPRSTCLRAAARPGEWWTRRKSLSAGESFFSSSRSGDL